MGREQRQKEKEGTADKLKRPQYLSNSATMCAKRCRGSKVSAWVLLSPRHHHHPPSRPPKSRRRGRAEGEEDRTRAQQQERRYKTSTTTATQHTTHSNTSVGIAPEIQHTAHRSDRTYKGSTRSIQARIRLYAEAVVDQNEKPSAAASRHQLPATRDPLACCRARHLRQGGLETQVLALLLRFLAYGSHVCPPRARGTVC